MTPVMVNNTNVREVVVDGRFQGPPGMGNGGYSAGLLAEQFAAGPVEITLKRPIPLNSPLRWQQSADGLVLLQQEGHILAEALNARLEMEVPIPPPMAKQFWPGKPTVALRRILSLPVSSVVPTTMMACIFFLVL